MQRLFTLIFFFINFTAFGQDAPNIILIMADDQGWNGTSVQMDPSDEGSKSDFYETPNIERIAASGMRFSRAYAPAPKCSPTRMSILTGQTTARNQFTNTSSMVTTGEVLIEPSSNTRITPGHFTIAELLETLPAEYLSAHFGKWHIGNNGPTSHGFDQGDGATSNDDGESGMTINDDPKKIFDLTNKGIGFMEGAIADDKPFYLQLSHYAVHTSIEYTQSSYSKYDSKTIGEKHDNIGFAAMTEDLDTGVGMILDFLEQNNIVDKTYVIYYSDNGAQNNLSSNAPLMGSKTLLFEGGVRVPLIVTGPGIESNSHTTEPVIGYDFFPTFAEWAGAGTSDLPSDLDGVSLASLLAGTATSISRTTPLIFHSPHYETSMAKEPRSAIISGDLKLVVEYETGDRLQYDLLLDQDESQNLYESSSQTSKELVLQLRDYLKEVEAQMPAYSDSDPDVDGDGLPDAWEFVNLLGTQYSATDDPDGDSVSNGDEYSMGGDPLVSDGISTGFKSPESSLIVYPNPVSTVLNLSFDEPSTNRNFELYRTNGQVMFAIEANAAKTTISISNLVPGLYFYKVVEDTSVRVGKLRKE